MIISDGKRLAYYQARANIKFWSGHWKEQVGKTQWLAGEHGELGWFEEPFVKYLPKAGKIIEAGCGLGYYVLSLARRGYDIEGVEWSRKAVQLIRQRYPKLKVKTGDVRKLTVKDGHYSAYISLGVVEHFQAGPKDYLHEANRVLKPGGVAFVSVPHFNLLRRIKNLLGYYRGDPSGLDFYQYAFTEAEIDRIIEKAGFKLIDHFRYDAYKGIKEELPFLRNLLSSLSVIPSPSTALGTSCVEGSSRAIKTGRVRKPHPPKRPWWLKLADRYFGHMTMIICEKLN